MTDRPVTDAEIRSLLDKQEIRECLVRYCRGTDRRDVEQIRSAYHEESWDYHGTSSVSGSAFADRYEHSAGPIMQHHHLGQTLIDLRGDVAYAETYFVAHARSRDGIVNVTRSLAGEIDDDGAADPDREVISLLVGRYVDRLDREDGEWRIKVRKVAMDWASEAPAPADRALFEAFADGHHGQRKPYDLVYRPDEMTLPAAASGVSG